MDQQRNADVVVPILSADLAIVGRVRRVLDLSGPALRRLVLVDDGRLDGAPEVALSELAVDPRVRRVHGTGGEGWVELCNLGLGVRAGDAVVLTAGARMSQGWLSDLADAAHFEDRVALAAAEEVASDPRGGLEIELGRAVEGLPRRTPTPRAGRCCNYLRGDALDAVGLLDPAFERPSAALDDWLMRATALGFFANRANHAFVFFDGPGDSEPASVAEAADGAALQARHPQFAAQVGRFEGSLDASLTRHAIDLQTTGRLRVALDLRHLPAEQNGTRMYAVNLGKALAALPQVDLTLIALHASQADGVPGRMVTPDDWADDVAVIHKPAQIFDRTHAKLLFDSRAHVFVTYQDLIAYRMPGVFATEADHDAYRNTSRLTLQAAQGVLAYSLCTAREIADEFALPIDEVSTIALGVDAAWFASPVAEADEIKARLGLPPRYFLGLAGDYPHKNMAGLLDAYAGFRRSWSDGEPPTLVLAGNAPVLSSKIVGRPGVSCLGVVSADELKVLYQNAEALVFPSLYEGFGLPPLEAMAAGAAVVAMPFSSVPEVCGDAALFSDGLKPTDLSAAMRRLAIDADLKSDLIARGRRRIESLRWRSTALATYEAYRNAVLRPSLRSLRMRRFLNEAILLWSQPPAVEVVTRQPEPEPVVEIVAPEPLAEFVELEAEPRPVAEIVEPEPMVEPVAEIAEPEPEPVVEPVAEIVEPEPEPVAEVVEPEPDPGLVVETIEPGEGIVESSPVPVETTEMETGLDKPAAACVACELRVGEGQAEPMGVINACCALREALGRRVRRDVGHLKDSHRIRILQARRLSRRFLEVVRSDGIGAASRKTIRKLVHKMRPAATSNQL